MRVRYQKRHAGPGESPGALNMSARARIPVLVKTRAQ